MTPWSVSPSAGCRNSAARAASLSILHAPSSSEYSEWTWRWAQAGVVTGRRKRRRRPGRFGWHAPLYAGFGPPGPRRGPRRPLGNGCRVRANGCRPAPPAADEDGRILGSRSCLAALGEDRHRWAATGRVRRSSGAEALGAVRPGLEERDRVAVPPDDGAIAGAERLGAQEAVVGGRALGDGGVGPAGRRPALDDDRGAVANEHVHGGGRRSRDVLGHREPVTARPRRVDDVGEGAEHEIGRRRGARPD